MPATDIINPRRACAARVTVLGLCVFPILAVRTMKSITENTIVLSVSFAAILKRHFSLNCLTWKLERFLLTSAGAAIFS